MSYVNNKPSKVIVLRIQTSEYLPLNCSLLAGLRAHYIYKVQLLHISHISLNIFTGSQTSHFGDPLTFSSHYGWRDRFKINVLNCFLNEIQISTEFSVAFFCPPSWSWKGGVGNALHSTIRECYEGDNFHFGVWVI